MGFQDDCFFCLELRRGKPFGVDQGLLALITIGRQLGNVGLSHFDVVTKDVVVANFQVIDPGCGPFFFLQFRNPLLTVLHRIAVGIQLLIVTRLDDSPLGNCHRGILNHGPVNQSRNIAQRIQPRR